MHIYYYASITGREIGVNIRCVAIQGTKERNQRVREEYKVD